MNGRSGVLRSKQTLQTGLRGGLTILLLLAAACGSGDGERKAKPNPAPNPPSVPTPAETGNAIFDYLLARYDADGDGAIAAQEYDRPGDAFTRLDRDGDDRITEGDVRPSGRRQRALPSDEARRLRAVHLLGWYFQDDDKPQAISIAEMLSAFQAYDANGDERIGRSEFEMVAEERIARGRQPAGRWAGLVEVETTDPWERIVLGVDRDEDSFLRPSELESFFAENEALDAWSFKETEVQAPTQSLVGRRAPDFTLPRLGGSDSVTLSDFAGERPVALIFGSYT